MTGVSLLPRNYFANTVPKFLYPQLPPVSIEIINQSLFITFFIELSHTERFDNADALRPQR